MSRISIDVTPEQHQRLKALAALQGKSIKEFVLASTLGTLGVADHALSELEAVLDARISEANAARRSTQTVESVFKQAPDELGPKPNG